MLMDFDPAVIPSHTWMGQAVDRINVAPDNWPVSIDIDDDGWSAKTVKETELLHQLAVANGMRSGLR